MPSVYPFGGIYDRWGYARRNELMEAQPLNKKPDNAMKMDCGDAGRDGYTVLSRADRMSGERQISHAEPFCEAPKNSEDIL